MVGSCRTSARSSSRATLNSKLKTRPCWHPLNVSLTHPLPPPPLRCCCCLSAVCLPLPPPPKKRRVAAEVEGDVLGEEFKGYVFKIMGGQDKQV